MTNTLRLIENMNRECGVNLKNNIKNCFKFYFSLNYFHLVIFFVCYIRVASKLLWFFLII